MLESFVIMLREGIESALVMGILVTLLRRSGRRDLMRPVWAGFILAVLASMAAAFLLKRELMPFPEQVYEGVLYWGSAVFVVSMMVWIHRRARHLKGQIENQVERAMGAGAGAKQAALIGLFAFLMIFREGAETVMFLAAVKLTHGALLSFAGTLLGLAGAVTFYAMFVGGSLRVDLGRFFKVTQWMLAIFVFQLVVNGYQEFSELGAVPATAGIKAFLEPIVANNTLFIIALAALPLFIWLTRDRRPVPLPGKREILLRRGAVAASLVVIAAMAAGYARELMVKSAPRIVSAPSAE